MCWCFVCLLFSLWCVVLIVLYCVVLCVYELSVGLAFDCCCLVCVVNWRLWCLVVCFYMVRLGVLCADACCGWDFLV